MKKIPLETTVVEAYKFLFQNILSIIGTIWLPILALVVVIAALVASVIPHAWLTGGFSPPADPEAFVLSVLPVIMLAVPVITFAGLLTGAMVRVGILRHALGLKTTTTWAYFSLESRVWRMVAVALLGVVVYIGVILVAAMVIGAFAFGLKLIPDVPPFVTGLVIAVLVVAAIVWAIYVMLRMFFFLPAVVVAENKVGVGRSWSLGKGNALRMFVVLIAVTLPVVIIGEIAIYATMLSTLISIGLQQPDMNSPAAAIAMLQSMLPLIPVVLVIVFLMMVSITGLTLGAVGKAYKAVTAEA